MLEGIVFTRSRSSELEAGRAGYDLVRCDASALQLVERRRKSCMLCHLHARIAGWKIVRDFDFSVDVVKTQDGKQC